MTSNQFKHKLSSLKRPSSFSNPQLAIFVLVFAAIGFLIYRSLAATPLIATMEAESMVLPSGATTLVDTTASAGKAVLLPTNGTATGTVNFPTSVSSLTILARGTQCNGAPAMNVTIDNQSLLSATAVSSSSWASYSNTPPNPIASGTHSYSISFTNDYTKLKGSSGKASCSRDLYLDVSSFYGPIPAPTPAPTVTISASPSSVTAGSASTLTWNSTNADSCTASGSWSGTQPTSGSTSTGALNQNSSYTLACTGAGGTVSAFASVSVNPTAVACVNSSTAWQNYALSSQSGTFSQTFNVTPSGNNIDADVGFSTSPAGAYTDLAAIVEFNTAGNIVARNGGSYSAVTTVVYSAGTTYSVRMIIDVATHTYSVFITPPNSSEIQIASGFAFRTEQAAAASIGNWATISSTGSIKICGLPVLASTPSSTWSYTVAPPVSPGPTITNMSGLGLNITTLQNLSDIVIDGTGDSGALFQLNAGGSTMNRVRMTNVAAGNAVSYGKHGVYGKVRNLTLQDIDISCSSYCASGVSLRYDGAQLRRFILSGAPHAITYYETSTTAGTVTIENGSGSFTADTAIWMDAETSYTQQVIQRFVIRNVSFTGNGAFMRVAGTRFASPSVTVEHCFINGRPVTAADLPGVPNVTLLP